MKRFLLFILLLFLAPSVWAHNPILGDHFVYGDFFASSGAFTGTSNIIIFNDGESMSNTTDGELIFSSNNTYGVSLIMALDNILDYPILTTPSDMIGYDKGAIYDIQIINIAATSEATTYQMLDSDYICFFTSNGVYPKFIKMPDPLIGQTFYIKNTDNPFISIIPFNTETVGGLTSIEILNGDGYWLTFDGNDWVVTVSELPVRIKEKSASTEISNAETIIVCTGVDVVIKLSAIPVDAQVHTIKAANGIAFIDSNTIAIDGVTYTAGAPKPILADNSITIMYNDASTEWRILTDYKITSKQAVPVSTATTTIDWAKGSFAYVSFSTPTTALTFINGVNGVDYTILFYQATAGSRTATYTTPILRTGGAAEPVLTSTAFAYDIITFKYLQSQWMQTAWLPDMKEAP